MVFFLSASATVGFAMLAYAVRLGWKHRELEPQIHRPDRHADHHSQSDW